MMHQGGARIVAVVAVVAAGLHAAAACSSFDDEPVDPAGSDGGRIDASEPDALVTDGGAADGAALLDAGCAAPCVAVMTGAIQSLSCAGPEVYVGLETEIVKVTKATRAASSFLALGAQHMYPAVPIVFSDGTTVRGGDGGPIASAQTGLAGVAATSTAAYWTRGDELWSRPSSGGGPVQLASAPADGQGLLVSDGMLYVAVPSLQRVHARELSGLEVDAGLDVVTGDDVFSLASSGGKIYWVAPAAHAIRYATWANRNDAKTLVAADAGAGAMRSVCADATDVYFGVGAELHRVPVAP